MPRHTTPTTKVKQKWGFGMAIPKPHTQQKRVEACNDFCSIINDTFMPEPTPSLLESLSELKGMFNRIQRKDQWDWFTVSSQFGHPAPGLCRLSANAVAMLRTSVKERDLPDYEHSRRSLHHLKVLDCLAVFLGRKQIQCDPNAGWIYILSTREQRTLLNIGTTSRTIEDRCRVINSATGVAFPFGVVRCWRIQNPSVVEGLVHEALKEFRLRVDRDFFTLPLSTAAAEIQALVEEHDVEIRTLDVLTTKL